jgi:replicative DNA helicase
MAKARKDAITKSNATVTVTDTEEMEENGIEGVRDKIIEHDPDVVMIDGAYLLTEAGKGSETEKATRISRATKRLAKNRDVLVMQTLQMNRSAEDAEDGGDLQNISWSDAIGQDCLPADTLLDTVDGLCYIVDLEDEEFFIN